MNQVSLVVAIALMLVAVTGRKGRLIALSLGWLTIYPAIRTLGIRSAVFVPEMVIAAALIPWLLRTKDRDLSGAPGWYSSQLIFIVIWVFMVTFFGHITLATGDLYIRVPMAVLRVAAPLLSFAIPASMTLSRKDMAFVLRFLRYAVFAFLVLGLLDYLNLTPVTLYFQVRDLSAADVKQLNQEGFLNRAGLGALGLVGIFVCLLSNRLREGIRPLNLAAVVGFVALILLSQSRSSLLGLIVFGLALIAMQRGNRVANLLTVAVGSITVYLVALNIPFVAERLGTMETLDSALATSGRVDGWKRAIAYLLGDPLALMFGVGYDCWALRLANICGLSNGHSTYLHAIGELGLIGGGAYLAIFARIAVQCLTTRSLAGDGRIVSGLTLAFLCSLACSAVAVIQIYPVLSSLIVAHLILFIFGTMLGRIRYIIAEQHQMAGSRAVPDRRSAAGGNPVVPAQGTRVHGVGGVPGVHGNW